MLERCKQLCLLAEGHPTGQAGPAGTRLAHDTLAPLVRNGTTARTDWPSGRVGTLRNRLPGWEQGREGSPLDRHDMEIVERAALWMRAWSHDECRLIESSRLACSKLERDRIRLRAEGFLLAMRSEPGPIGSVELDNLWELAGLDENDDEVRVWVIRLAIGERRRALRFETRLEPAVHAAVGLHPERRRSLLDEVILTQMRNPSVDRETRWVAARIGLELEEEGVEFTARCQGPGSGGGRRPSAQLCRPSLWPIGSPSTSPTRSSTRSSPRALPASPPAIAACLIGWPCSGRGRRRAWPSAV